MSVISRENIELQTAFQIIAKKLGGDMQLGLLDDEEVLAGYVAYKGHMVTSFRLSTEDWPPREEFEQDIPSNVIGVFEPMREERDEPVFMPLEEYLESFDIQDYCTPNNSAGQFLDLRI